MKRLFYLLTLFYLFLGFGCILNTDCRTCADCQPSLDVPLAFKVKKGLDSFYFQEFNFSEPFRKIDNRDTISKYQAMGYKIDTVYYSYNYQPRMFFRKNVDESINFFRLYFKDASCYKYTVDCANVKGRSGIPCCN